MAGKEVAWKPPNRREAPFRGLWEGGWFAVGRQDRSRVLLGGWDAEQRAGQQASGVPFPGKFQRAPRLGERAGWLTEHPPQLAGWHGKWFAAGVGVGWGHPAGLRPEPWTMLDGRCRREEVGHSRWFGGTREMGWEGVPSGNPESLGRWLGAMATGGEPQEPSAAGWASFEGQRWDWEPGLDGKQRVAGGGAFQRKRVCGELLGEPPRA